MPDFLDRIQDAESHLSDQLNAYGRLPDVPVPVERLCIGCFCDIPPARLAAVPTATRCIRCESAYQHSQGRHR